MCSHQLFRKPTNTCAAEARSEMSLTTDSSAASPPEGSGTDDIVSDKVPLSENAEAMNHTSPHHHQQPISVASRRNSRHAPNGPAVHRHVPARSHAYPYHNVYERNPPTPSREVARKDGYQENGKSSALMLRELFMEQQIDISETCVLGAGRYSKVITAICPTKKRMIAIKMVNTSRMSEKFRTKFLPREILCWKSLKHPFLVRFLEHYVWLDHVFLTMEFGEWGDMRQFVQRSGPIGEEKAGMWMSQIVAGVAYMAERAIAHRDLKLENIIIFNDKTVKISDFGFARNMSPKELSTTYCGTTCYMAPEILLVQPYDPFKSDVWSVGVIGFVMVTDCLPFLDSWTNEKIVESQKNRAYSFPPELKISEDVQVSINTMLTYQCEQRPNIYDCARFPWIQPHVEKTKAAIEAFDKVNVDAAAPETIVLCYKPKPELKLDE